MKNKTRFTDTMSPRSVRAFCGLILLGAAGTASASTITDINQLMGSAFGNYSLVVEGTKSLQLTSDTGITGNVAVGSGVTLQGAGSTIHGNLDYQSGNSGSGITVTGTTSTNDSQVGSAIADAQSLASLYGAVTNLSALSSGTLNVTSNPGQSYNGNTNEHVYAINTNFTTDLTITAAANQYVVFDVGAGSSANFSLVAVTLGGGITSDHVLFNIETTGALSSSNAHNQAVNAVVVDNAGSVNVDNFTLNGRLFCNATSANCQVVSNADIISSATTATPEPGTILLIGAGLLAVGLVSRRAKNKD